jgi:hypothetical protein
MDDRRPKTALTDCGFDPLILHFFRCNIGPKGALFLESGQTAHFFSNDPHILITGRIV